MFNLAEKKFIKNKEKNAAPWTFKIMMYNKNVLRV